MARKPQHTGAIGAVAFTGESQRTMERYADTPGALAALRNIRAAAMGPTVCELEGPMPILNSSNTERNIQLTVR